MSKFLDTQAISSELMNLIKEAKEKIVLVSPYLSVNVQIQERLKTKSKIGTLGDISIIYGKSELKPSEKIWMKEIEDLKVFEKSNLHAKCYVNEQKAIICSMNLYDYSQQNNIEMGILISRKEDHDAYEQLLEEIHNLKINGTRKRFNEIQSFLDKSVAQQAPSPPELSNREKLRKQLLKEYRKDTSRKQRKNMLSVMTDEQIDSIVEKADVKWNDLKLILSQKQLNQFGNDILYWVTYANEFAIGKVVNTWYQTDDSQYDRVKLLNLETNQERWYDTVQELPRKNQLVGVKLNRTWFNEYLYLES